MRFLLKKKKNRHAFYTTRKLAVGEHARKSWHEETTAGSKQNNIDIILNTELKAD